MMKRWDIKKHLKTNDPRVDTILDLLLEIRGFTTAIDKKNFLSPPNPLTLTPLDVDIDTVQLEAAVERIKQAIERKESVVVYADYDADGVTAGSILWETLHAIGLQVMPYIPHRVDEGYGLSIAGIDKVKEQYGVNLIVTVDHGITAREKVAYAKSLGIDVIVTDHHTKPEILPECSIVHTTQLSGSGVSWFFSKTLLDAIPNRKRSVDEMDLVALTTIGTVADLLPLTGPNRSIVKFGLQALKKTVRVGLTALMKESGIDPAKITTYEISHMLAPRLNAIGRLDHALDALRLLCTTSAEKADTISKAIGIWNKERQQLTVDSTEIAKDMVYSEELHLKKKMLIVSHEEFNQGIIGLVAGRLVEEFYLPTIVLAKGEKISKASARSIHGFNIVEAIRAAQAFLLEVGGHPMAAGFSLETEKIELFEEFMQSFAQLHLTPELLMRSLTVDLEMPLEVISDALWLQLQKLQPFGMGNYEPVFVSRNIPLKDVRLIGKEGKHLKIKLLDQKKRTIEAVAFKMGERYESLLSLPLVDIAYTLDMNEWNGNTTLQLKLKDIMLSQ